MIQEAHQIWYKKLRPPQKDEFSIERLPTTNIFLTKDFQGRIGLIIENTLEIPKTFTMKKFEFKYFDTLENKGKGTIYERCQMMLADKTIEPDYLIKILFGILEIKSKRKITSRDLMNVLVEVKKTFDPEEQKRNEIIGVWGELFLLNKLLSTQLKKNRIAAIIKGWESDRGRMKVDMRFKFCKIAIEIKTTSLEERIHHICGHEQFIIPSGFNFLLLLSIRIMEDEAGITCKDLLDSITLHIKDKELINALKERVLLRGEKLCMDDLFQFTLRDKQPFAFFDSKSFPLPSRPKGIINMRWEQNFDTIKSLDNKRVTQIFSLIRE